ncbi:hypothetical protein HW115_16015 [Verrucomicrobiaceae bacterium N1E253]|uniref:Uncharacterized protein n=1 Tax=Oceaniferula marina TaxID=2748318 RepID=A0A851GH63_9BACT|nr:hypothetical protein [Oceaniferula marina]NWK57128.1 hypothetical protein [Oceaniferula marina]
MALMIAIGDLQKYAGPDQRVTATAGILDTDPQSAEVDGIRHPNWVGVWRTDGLKKEDQDTAIIVADPDRDHQALIDRREDAGYDRESEVLSWLVSGEDSDPKQSAGNNEMVRLYAVDNLPVGVSPDAVDVYAERVRVMGDSSVGGAALKGHYAYWVSDEGTKAKMNIGDVYAGKNPDKNDPSDGGYFKYLTAQRNDFTQIFADYDQVAPDEIFKMMTGSQASLLDMGVPEGYSDASSAMDVLRHDITTYSSSLLVNVAEGGLKKDLTAYLESSGTVPTLGTMPGVSDELGLIGHVDKRETIGPKYGALRSWYALKEDVSGGLGSRSVSMTTPNVMPGGPAIYHSGGVDPTKFTKQPIHPVLKEAVYYVSHAYDSNPTSRKVYEFIYPRVVLWNPYNVTLNADEMYVLMDMRLTLYVKYRFRDSSGAWIEKSFDTWLAFGGLNANTRAFTIPATSFKPGEALVFTAMPTGSMLKGKAVPFSDPRSNLRGNRLSASHAPSELHCFYNEKGTLPVGTDMSSVSLRYGGIFWNGTKPTQSVYLFGANEGGTPTVNNLGTSAFPTLQQIHLDNYSRENNGRWLPTYYPYSTYDLDELLSGGVSPDTLNAFGLRFRHIYESHSNRANGVLLDEPWYSAPIIHNNIRAGRVHRWSRDNFFGQRYAGGAVDANYSGPAAHLYSYGPLAQCRQWPEWNDSEVAPHFNDGRYRSAVFTDSSFGGSSHVYPLFDLPHKDVPLFSLASLQHVQLTPYLWHPSYAIGNSFAPPYNDLGVTAQSWNEERDEWGDKLRQLQPGVNDFVHQLNSSNDNTQVYDLSYEVNHSIWDKFFLSSIPRNKSHHGWGGGNEWSEDVPIPNSRYHVVSSYSDAGSYDELTDYHKSAKGLIVDGALNVNSTSVLAWESFLRAFNGIGAPVRSGPEGSSDGHSFSRFMLPESRDVIPADISESGLWGGYRRLSDDDIRRLAEEIVIDVKKRGPFISMADFVNRRLLQTETSFRHPEIAYAGALQSAINRAGLNDALQGDPASEFTMPDPDKAKTYQYGAEYWGGPIRTPKPQQYDTFEYQPKSGSKLTISEAAGASGYLMQGDILQKVGAALSARSDTFVVRAYGDSVDARGQVLARAWCEAVVQRTVEPIHPDQDSAGLNPVKGDSRDLGRRFKVISFRWLTSDEV